MKTVLLVLTFLVVTGVTAACICVSLLGRRTPNEGQQLAQGAWRLSFWDQSQRRYLSADFSDGLTLGRGRPGADEPGRLSVGQHNTISTSQCWIYETEGGLAILNLSRVNMTFLNGRSLDNPQYLFPGDQISMGGHQYLLMGMEKAG